jgi:hypothetical protein
MLKTDQKAKLPRGESYPFSASEVAMLIGDHSAILSFCYTNSEFRRNALKGDSNCFLSPVEIVKPPTNDLQIRIHAVPSDLRREVARIIDRDFRMDLISWIEDHVRGDCDHWARILVGFFPTEERMSIFCSEKGWNLVEVKSVKIGACDDEQAAGEGVP